MNILFLTDNFPPESNAPANRTFEHTKHWVELGHSVTVITCAPNFPSGKIYEGYKNKWYQVEDMAGIKVVRVKTYMTANEKFTRRVFDFFSFMVMGTIASLFQRKPDLIVATSPQFFCGIAGMIASTMRRVPFVLEVRDLWPDSILAVGVSATRPGIQLLRKLEKMMYCRAKLIIVVSKAFVKPIQNKIPNSDKIRVVTNGVDSSLFAKQMSDDIPLELAETINNKFVVSYIGTHGRAHGLLTVIKAAESLSKREDILFLLVGSGEKRDEIIQWTQERNLTNVHFMPLQKRHVIPKLIDLSHAAIVPLRNLPLFSTVIPSKIFEFMAMGKPMIVSIPRGETTNIIEQYDCGLVVEPENHVAMADAIASIHQNPHLLNALGENAKKASINFERSKKADEMIALMQILADRENKHE